MNNYYAVFGDKKYYFYHNLNGICFKEYSDGVFKNEKILLENSSPGFDMQICCDEFNILCQDDKGTIVFLSGNETFHKYEVLFSKSQKPTNKHLRLISTNNILSMFCTITYDGNLMLSHKFLNDTESVPSVIDIVSSCTKPYDVCTDNDNNIYICYTDENLRLKLKKSVWSKKAWENTKTILNDSEVYNPLIIIKDNEPVISYITKLSSYYNIACYYKGEHHTVYLDCSPNVLPLLAIKNNILYVSFTESGNIYYSSFDKKFSHVMPYNKISDTPNTIIGIRNIGFDPNLILYYSYGSISRGEINILHLDKYTPPKKAEEEISIRPRGYEVLDYAGIDYKEPDDLENEIKKLKIRLDLIEKQLKTE